MTSVTESTGDDKGSPTTTCCRPGPATARPARIPTGPADPHRRDRELVARAMGQLDELFASVWGHVDLDRAEALVIWEDFLDLRDMLGRLKINLHRGIRLAREDDCAVG